MKITDPVLKNRVVFIGNTSPATKWLPVIGIVFIFLAGVAGVLVYFPNTLQYVNNRLTGSPTNSVPPEVLQPVASVHDDASMPPLLKTSEEATTHSTASAVADTGEIGLTVPNSSAASPIVSETALTVQNPPAASPSGESFVDDEKTTPPLVQPKNPTVSEDDPPKPVAAAAEESVSGRSNVATEPSIDIEETLENLLLAKAKRQIARTRLTTPQGDNAYETYQDLLKISPQSAQLVLEDIVDWYFELGLKFIDKDKLAQAKQGSAYEMYQKLDELAPTHQSTQTLLSELIDALIQRGQQQLARKQLISPKDNNAYATYQEILTVMPNSPQTQEFSETLRKRLFARAAEQMNKHRYTTPKNNNATDTYQKILKIFPNNADAQQGLSEIAKEYYQLAATKKRLGKYQTSITFINRGLEVLPDDPNLNQLKQEVLTEMSNR